ncbi:MAG: D-alanine--D-alanine ligase, partial [Acidimicrobiales bacterium]
MPTRRRLVVLFGGRSAEHDVSCMSARHVLAAVDTGHYEVVPVGIGLDGCWSLAADAAAALAEGRVE